MVPPDSTGIPRAPAYSGTLTLIYSVSHTGLSPSLVRRSRRVPLHFRLSLPQWPHNPADQVKPNRFGLFPVRSPLLRESLFDFSSSRYLDVSVPWVGSFRCCDRDMTPSGFPHSDISGSTLACSSPKLFAACHVLHRRLVPRHPPCALTRLTRHRLRLPARSSSLDFELKPSKPRTSSLPPSPPASEILMN